MSHVLTTLVDVLADVPNPGAGTAPPGFDKFTDIMGWVKYLALGVLVVALIAAGVRLAVSDGHSGGGVREGAAIGKVLMGVIVVSAAFTVVSFLVGK